MNLATILSYLYPLIGENLRITSYNKWIFVNFTKNHTFTHEKKADLGSVSGLAHIPEPIPDTRISRELIPELTPDFPNCSATYTRAPEFLGCPYQN